MEKKKFEYPKVIEVNTSCFFGTSRPPHLGGRSGMGIYKNTYTVKTKK